MDLGSGGSVDFTNEVAVKNNFAEKIKQKKPFTQSMVELEVNPAGCILTQILYGLAILLSKMSKWGTVKINQVLFL